MKIVKNRKSLFVDVRSFSDIKLVLDFFFSSGFLTRFFIAALSIFSLISNLFRQSQDYQSYIVIEYSNSCSGSNTIQVIFEANEYHVVKSYSSNLDRLLFSWESERFYAAIFADKNSRLSSASASLRSAYIKHSPKPVLLEDAINKVLEMVSLSVSLSNGTPKALNHGDFARWNVWFDYNNRFVCIDWDDSFFGPAYFDVFIFFISIYYPQAPSLSDFKAFQAELEQRCLSLSLPVPVTKDVLAEIKIRRPDFYRLLPL